VALSFRSQLVDQVPVEAHDVGVDAIITPDEVIVCTTAGAAALPPSQ
jgi:5-formyltetrahydrofolate cyclo-ligase